MLKKNKILMHLDLSHNNLSELFCQEIQSRILKNHTLFGLHLEGNSGSVDSLGFIEIISDEKNENTPLMSPETKKRKLLTK